MYLTTFIIEIVIIARSHRSVRFCVMICQHVSQSVMQVDQLNNTLLFCSNSPLISNSALVARWYFFVLFLPLSATVIGGVLLIGSLMLFGAFPPLFSNRAFVARGILVYFFTYPHITLKIVWLGPLCCFFLSYWCFSPTCHHKNFSDLVLFVGFSRVCF